MLAWAVVAGAGMVELPLGYNDPTKWINLSPTGLSCYDQEYEGGAKCLDTPPTAPMDVIVTAGTPPAPAVDLSWSAAQMTSACGVTRSGGTAPRSVLPLVR